MSEDTQFAPASVNTDHIVVLTSAEVEHVLFAMDYLWENYEMNERKQGLHKGAYKKFKKARDTGVAGGK